MLRPLIAGAIVVNDLRCDGASLTVIRVQRRLIALLLVMRAALRRRTSIAAAGAVLAAVSLCVH